MKTINSLILLISTIALFSCTSKSDHPQADLIPDGSSTEITDKSILSFSDSINKNINSFEKRYSLVYMLGDNSLYVERYNNQSGDKIYFEHLNNGTSSTILNKYYFKSDSLVFIESSSKQIMENGPIFKDIRIYLRNNTAFKKEDRTAASLAAIKTQPYLLVQNPDAHAAEESYFEKINVLNDAIAQHNKFEMVFDNVATYPDTRFLILKSKIPNNYTASVMVQNKTDFIDSLLNQASTFKNEKLNFKWVIKDNEAIYVPERDSVTSASGLNR
jgi:hypothetical protein